MIVIGQLILVTMTSFAYLIARLLLGLLFFLSGLFKVLGGANFGKFNETKLPGFGFMAWPISIYELLVGLFVIIEFKTKITALTLAVFCIFTGLVYHGIVGDVEFTATLKNFALAGGYLMLFCFGAGKWALVKS